MTADAEGDRTVILGAGPAGLSAAACLGRRGLPYLLLEKGDAACAALHKVHPGMTLVSPRPVSRLPYMESLAGKPTYMELGTYLEVLDRYREQNQVEVETGAEVQRVVHEDYGFRVIYRAGGSGRTATGRFVINATGVLSAPVLPPDFDPDGTKIPWRHSRDVHPEDLAACRRLLLIGGGLSAADVASDWLRVRGPEARAWISLRSPLWVAPKKILGVDVHYTIWLPEQLPVLPVVWRKLQTNPILGFELPRTIRRGDLHEVGAVAAYRQDRVEIDGGEVLEPDLMVFATGYKYATPHLGDLFRWPSGGRPRVRCCESLDTPSLFLLGIHFARTFASPYLRGIGRDAAYVARRIERRIARAS
jgi:putative flavoprotein involved in K+ transport